LNSQKNILGLNFFQSVCIGVIVFISILSVLEANAADDKKKDVAPPAAQPAYIPPLPRHIEFPTISYGREPSIDGETEANLSTMRFWYIAVIASWNPRSEEITDVLNKNIKQFGMRNVGVIGLFSNDTMDSVSAWRKKNKPLFLNEFASRNLLDLLKNPKIPTVWVLGSHGEILQRLEMPTKEKMIESVEKVMILTGF
jgi:hypothetical protein